MNSLTALAAGHDQEDERVFGDLLEQVGALVERGDSAGAEAVIDAHPEYADRLRRILPTIQALAAFEEPDELSTGRTLVDLGDAPDRMLGDFRIRGEVGRGGMGVVYEAVQVSLGRRVALKVLPYASLLDARQLERFKNEARVAAGLHHTNIVPVYTVGSDRGVYYYAMQFIEGRDLADVVQLLRRQQKSSSVAEQRKSGVELQNSSNSTPQSAIRNPQFEISSPQSPAPSPRSAPIPHSDTQPIVGLPTVPVESRERFRTVAEWAVTVADALAYAHSVGILHRDIKPANLMLDNAGTIWISDFGLARIECDAGMTMTGDVVGTLRYMSPELAQGDHAAVNARTDIYALGATLYELLTLQPAFNAADRSQLLRQINEEEPLAPRRINPTIPADLETIVLKAMSKDAASRYATAQDVADDLRRHLANKPIQARRPTLFERAGKWARRHAALVASAGAALVVATISFLIAVLLTLRAYNLEAQQRAAAVANLRVASDSIDRMLSRLADVEYFHGDLAHAERLAADATEFYEKLLAHSDDLELRFRAAEAHENVAGIWYLVGQHEKARASCLRCLELLRPLIAANPIEKYLNARGGAYLTLGRAEAGLQRFHNTEEPWQLAAADFQYLIEHYPHESKYRGSLANTLSNLGMFCWTRSQLDGAEKCYKRSIEIRDSLTEKIANTPEYLTAKAGTLSNWAMVAREQGDTKRAFELLEQANALQKRSLEQWPDNPEGIDSQFNQYWHISETSIRARDHRAAARAVETLVWAFPDRLKAYHYGAEQLLKCAELSELEGTPTVHHSLQADPAKQLELLWEAKSKSREEGYRERALELIARAHTASSRTPDSIQEFAWFLVTYKDDSFQDPEKAVKLATAVLNDITERGPAWLTLALANYRLGDWQAADEALQESIQYPRGGGSHVCELLVRAMLRHQQGRADEAREWHHKARDWLAKNSTDFEYVQTLAKEADSIFAYEPDLKAQTRK